MEKQTVQIHGMNIDVYSLNTVVVGTGAAGFNAADSLYSLGQRDIAIVTEGINMGTSRNTGSDKQTYYKLTLAGGGQDSVADMAQTLFAGGSMHGDIALVEAALSTASFFKLVNAGVPFPHNKYGEYIGYKTDHDPRQRATSAGPLTSKYMTEKLEQQVLQKGIKIFDRFLVIGILTDEDNARDNGKKAIGLIAMDMEKLEEPDMGFTLFNCTNIIYATGGPAGIYSTSVYPKSQTGASGIAYEAGVRGINITESQYGIASTKFRWNLSGTYQQVLPRYLSAEQDGSDEREFLDEYFEDPGKMLDAIFLKGYQWPFDPRKIENYGSSLIDILVYNETQIKGRKVYLDFTRNLSAGCRDGELQFSLLGSESYEYLKKSDALFGTPIERLAKMNQPAIDLYKNNGIDLTKEYLEIAVCAQHSNGGLLGNIWWESNVAHFFPVGEVNGTFGVYRPGGSALNSTQVGSLRAAQYIYNNYNYQPQDISVFAEKAAKLVNEKISFIKNVCKNMSKETNVLKLRQEAQQRMSRNCAHIRSIEGALEVIKGAWEDLSNLESEVKIASAGELPNVLRSRDILITQLVYAYAIKNYIEEGGKSRGSYLVRDISGNAPIKALAGEFNFSLDEGAFDDKTCEVELHKDEGKYFCKMDWKPVRPIPEADSWFENVWNQYMKGEVVK